MNYLNKLFLCSVLFLMTGFLISCHSQKSDFVTNNFNLIEMEGMNENFEEATFGAGCFWCVEAIFNDLKGVKKVMSGYSNGKTDNPTYEEVCSGVTGHAEVVRIVFDPQQIDFETLLKVFWHVHDPTTLNRQGNDIGTQYRSGVYYHSEKQKEIAQKSKDETNASGLWPKPIVTEITEIKSFFPAEDYHQNFFANNPGQPYCAAVVAPKVNKFRQNFKHLLKSEM